MNLNQKFKKISRGGSRSPDNAEFDHFTLLFCRGRQRNVPRIITHVHSHCHPRTFLFRDVRVAVAIVVFLNSLLCGGGVA